MAGPFDFTGQNIEDSYQRVLQINDNAVYNGTGSLVNSINVTASFAQTASFVNPLNQSVTITGSLTQGAPGNIASGISSHAEGVNTQADGDYSHAEGLGTQAVGYASHTEGYVTTSSGSYSHAEGLGTSAEGDYSHAEGESTLARAATSHAEGYGTQANEYASHAEGYNTQANGVASHAEGFGTIASGSYQHVQGQYNITSSAQSAFIIGNGIDSNNRSNLIFASGSRFQVTGSVIATAGFTGSLVGTASFAQTASFVNPLNQSVTITGSLTQGASGNIASGFGSHAEGLGTSAEGEYSHAEGRTTQTSGRYSHAEGLSTTASAFYSHAEGLSTIASGLYQHVQGQYNITSSANAAFIIGNGIDGNNRSNLVFASGSQFQVTGSVIATAGFTGSLFGTASFAQTASFVNPLNQSVTINGSLTQGQAGNIASGISSHAEGNSTQAVGDYSHAEGRETQAVGAASHAEGFNTQANGNYSHAEGLNTQANGEYSHAEGNDTIVGSVQGYRAISISSGVITLHHSYGDVSAEYANGNVLLFDDSLFDNAYGVTTFIVDLVSYNGGNTEITLTDLSVTTTAAIVGNITYGISNWAGEYPIGGQYSHAEGESTAAAGYASHAEGGGTQASGQYSHAEGESTVASGGASHAEGGGTQAAGYASHAEGIDTQAVGSYSHAEGEGTQASGVSSHAEGAGTQAVGSYSHAEGEGTQASGGASHAEGRGANASGDFSHAEGYNTQASGFSSHAEGQETQAVGDYSHAEGYYTQANEQASHAEGYGTIASGLFQHVQGQYNITSLAQSAFIIGNGIDDANRSNLVFASGSQVQITGSLIVSGSGTFTNIGPAIFSGSVASTAGFTGSLQGTASFAQTASFVAGTVGGSGTAGSIAKFSDTSIIGNATADTDYLINSVSTIAYTAMGSTIKGNGVAVDKPHNMTSNGSLTAGTVFFIAYYLPKAATITGVKWWQGVVAANSSGSFGLYSVSAGTLTRQASSSFDTTVFSTSQNTFKSKAFNSTYAAPAGLYYIGVLSGGNSGNIGNISVYNSGIYGADFTNNNKVVASAVGSSLPATQALSGTNFVQSAFGLFLY